MRKKERPQPVKKPAKCPFCGREFDDKFDVQEHFHNKHVSDSFKKDISNVFTS